MKWLLMHQLWLVTFKKVAASDNDPELVLSKSFTEVLQEVSWAISVMSELSKGDFKMVGILGIRKENWMMFQNPKTHDVTPAIRPK
jgi:hypothetical protein